MVIYKITNKVNGKVYIGQTRGTIEKRFKQHQHTDAKKQIVGSAIRKYGKENFIIEQIDSAPTYQELDEKERYWIKFYDSTNRAKGYNLTSGGLTGCSIPGVVRANTARRGKKQPKKTKWIEVVSLETGERFEFHGTEKAAEFAETTKDVISKSCCKKNGGRLIINDKWTAVHKGDDVGKIINTPKKYVQIIHENGKIEEYPTMIIASDAVGIKRESIQTLCELEVKDKYGRQWKFKNRY